MNYRILFICLFVGISLSLQADSPITSTPFYKAYLDLPEVNEAHKSGTITQSLAQYLSARGISIDKKAAVINALSWDFNGKKNAELFINHLKKKYRTTELQADSLSIDEHFCLGYLYAMDNYFHPEKGLSHLERADSFSRKSKKGSFTIALIHALVKSQMAMNQSWCSLWKHYDSVFRDPKLIRDIRPEAILIIHNYMILYRNECP